MQKRLLYDSFSPRILPYPALIPPISLSPCFFSHQLSLQFSHFDPYKMPPSKTFLPTLVAALGAALLVTLAHGDGAASAKLGDHLAGPPPTIVPDFNANLAAAFKAAPPPAAAGASSMSGSASQSPEVVSTTTTTVEPKRRLRRRLADDVCKPGQVSCGSSCICCGTENVTSCELDTLCSASSVRRALAESHCAGSTSNGATTAAPAKTTSSNPSSLVASPYASQSAAFPSPDVQPSSSVGGSSSSSSSSSSSGGGGGSELGRAAPSNFTIPPV